MWREPEPAQRRPDEGRLPVQRSSRASGRAASGRRGGSKDERFPRGIGFVLRGRPARAVTPPAPHGYRTTPCMSSRGFRFSTSAAVRGAWATAPVERRPTNRCPPVTGRYRTRWRVTISMTQARSSTGTATGGLSPAHHRRGSLPGGPNRLRRAGVRPARGGCLRTSPEPRRRRSDVSLSESPHGAERREFRCDCDPIDVVAGREDRGA